MRERYPALQNVIDEDVNNAVPGQWREHLQDVERATGHSAATKEAKKPQTIFQQPLWLCPVARSDDINHRHMLDR